MSFRSYDLIIRKGDKFSQTIILTDSAASESYTILDVDPDSHTWTIQGEHATTFASGKTFRVVGNTEQEADRVYTVSSVAASGGETVITLAANSTLTITAADHLADSFTIGSDVLELFPVGYRFFVTGNDTAAANREYTVKRAYRDGSNTIIVADEDVPSGVTASGVINRPVIPLRSTASGVVMRTADSAVDITNYTITSQVRDSAASSGTLIETFTVTKTDATAGTFTIGLSAAETAALIAGGRYWYDILIDQGGSEPPLRFPPDGPAKVYIKDTVTQA